MGRERFQTPVVKIRPVRRMFREGISLGEDIEINMRTRSQAWNRAPGRNPQREASIHEKWST